MQRRSTSSITLINAEEDTPTRTLGRIEPLAAGSPRAQGRALPPPRHRAPTPADAPGDRGERRCRACCRAQEQRTKRAEEGQTGRSTSASALQRPREATMRGPTKTEVIPVSSAGLPENDPHPCVRQRQ